MSLVNSHTAEIAMNGTTETEEVFCFLPPDLQLGSSKGKAYGMALAA